MRFLQEKAQKEIFLQTIGFYLSSITTAAIQFLMMSLFSRRDEANQFFEKSK